MTTANDSPILHLKDHGQSVWMDNLSRDLLVSGELVKLIDSRDVHGITSNPAIFEKAIAGNEIYDQEIEAGVRAGQSVDQIYETLVFDDIQRACDVLKPVYESSHGLDGYVSLEVPPNLAHDAEGTLAEARRYAAAIGRPNLMIKIPGTPEGLKAVEQTIRDGINVNVTLLFSVQSYIDTAWAYIRGLEGRLADGHDISAMASVASFFLSRIDSKVDNTLDQLAESDKSKRDQIAGLKGKVAIANAKLAYQEYKKIIQSDRWQALVANGANVQRLLWASTSTKNPAYSDVMYVDELIGPDTVNTLPPQTIEACADHCDVNSRIESDVDAAYAVIETLPTVGIDLEQVMDELLAEGIDKFIKPFDQLMDSLVMKVKQLSPA
ncbi:transaldolase [Leptolyngbyaceae cyanobacterium CCMR0082]|uniref:Transaldolase n=2 Tax=Adonisia turfae TaxID=2950184 RepID=A0A6M0SE05_9CYAN|nr:transaldolase [Adonisia turfae]NEZ60118.1 transaldolase [Adonisia turfae CCMR0081]NEZ66715.1 transaldolase [Adonisia turfae CCMR0082]